MTALPESVPGNTERIGRAELAQIIEEASRGCAERNREKLRRVAATTGEVAVGWFHYGGCGCPARQARYRHRGFQERFDRAMATRFDRPLLQGHPQFVVYPFAVRVVDLPLVTRERDEA